MDLESENTNDNPTHEDDSESRMEDENGNTTNTDTENSKEETAQENLSKKIQDTYSKNEDWQNKYVRVLADLENLKRRQIKRKGRCSPKDQIPNFQ